ncbi:hypothetical protein diail_1944 [Diaporthe ilicicola]|nr:hypothetical protein diail_1944 [Diaporthe ilicicola]
MSSSASAYLSRVYGAKSTEESKAAYDEWGSTYTKDIEGEEYTAPELTAQYVASSGGNITGPILDAGCGTGLCGIALAQLGAKHIDGVDLSTGMLKEAEKTGHYRDLAPADLGKPLSEKADASYDVVTCVGTLKEGHVGPVPALKEFVRVLNKDGVVVATVLESIWVSGGYEAEVDRLEGEGLVQVVSTDDMEFKKTPGLKGKMIVLKKK